MISIAFLVYIAGVLWLSWLCIKFDAPPLTGLKITLLWPMAFVLLGLGSLYFSVRHANDNEEE